MSDVTTPASLMHTNDGNLHGRAVSPGVSGAGALDQPSISSRVDGLPKARARGIFTLLALFAGTYAALEVGYCLLPDETLAAVYHWAMAAPMVQLLYLVDPAENVRSISNDLLSNHVNFRIVRGCDASGVLFLLMAAIVTVRAPLADKWKGMLGAIAVAYASNELRILALYITQRVHPSSFTLMHVYVLPLLIILLCVLYFVGWHGRTQQQPG